MISSTRSPFGPSNSGCLAKSGLGPVPSAGARPPSGLIPPQIQTQFEQLVQNFRWRAANADEIGISEEERRELGIRFHTEMVAIHVFVNGNGRHARLVANLVASAMGFGSLADPLYTWGARSGLPSAESRKLYLDAIKLAGSRGEYGPLLDIATS